MDAIEQARLLSQQQQNTSAEDPPANAGIFPAVLGINAPEMLGVVNDVNPGAATIPGLLAGTDPRRMSALYRAMHKMHEQLAKLASEAKFGGEAPQSAPHIGGNSAGTDGGGMQVHLPAASGGGEAVSAPHIGGNDMLVHLSAGSGAGGISAHVGGSSAGGDDDISSGLGRNLKPSSRGR